MELTHCIADKIQTYRSYIAEGHPYVWQLRLSGEEFETLEACIAQSVKAHSGSHRHLLSEEAALHLVVYFAEWYKRVYRGTETGDDAPVVMLDSEERKQLFHLAGINDNVFVYNASENPDKTNFRWKESLQVLGGLAVRDELRKDETDPFLSKLCKIFHGEEVDVNDVEDRSRAVAFQQSIVQQHSLYYYVEAILKKDYPFAKSDLADNTTPFSRLLRRIETADRAAKREKFDFEWLMLYAAYYKQIERRLRLRLKPEAIGGKLKQYIGYDRLRDFWGIEAPENVHRLMFDLRFVYGRHVVREASFNSPLLTFSNTGSEQTGFVVVGDIEEVYCTDVPTEPFTAVELWMQYDDERMRVQDPLDCSDDCLQVYKVAGTERSWSSRVRPQSATSVIFSNRYRLKDERQLENVVRVPFKNGAKESELMNWLPIYDVVTLVDETGHEESFFNRNGYYQVVAKKYLNTIKYEDNLYVTYKYVDLDEDELDEECEPDYMEEQVPLLFGREGLQVRHFPALRSAEWKPVETYELEWLSPTTGRYVDWNQQPPRQGKLRLRITVKGMVLGYRVYYVPFRSTNDKPQPVWRDFDKHMIRFALDGKADIPDTFHRDGGPEGDTKPVTLGTDREQVEMEVYRPYLLKELYQNGKLIQYLDSDETVEVPMLTCQQFSVRDFNEEGVHEIDCSQLVEHMYEFNDFHIPQPNESLFLESLQMNGVTGYLTKALPKAEGMTAWDYKGEPQAAPDGETQVESGIVFQSLKDNDHPRHYAKPRTITNDDSGWDWDDEEDDGDKMTDYEVYCRICEHKTYFFLFEPMRTMVKEGRMIESIVMPLLKERAGRLNAEDCANLYRLAREFHFDWMLLPREQWQRATENDEKQSRWVTDFFATTPKATDEREVKDLTDMMSLYWTFDGYSTKDPLAQKALRMILGDVDGVLGRNETWEMFLTDYDKCRYKFAEMSRIICKIDKI